MTLKAHSHTCAHKKSCTRPHVYASLNIHTGSYMSVRVYTHALIRCMSMFNIFFQDSHIHTSTHISVHMCCSRMPTSASTHIPCMQASPSMYAPTNMPFTAAPTSTQSRTCTHTHAYTRFDHTSAFTTTSIDICAHTSWRMVIRPMCAHMSLGGMSVHVYTCATRAGLHASVHTS